MPKSIIASGCTYILEAPMVKTIGKQIPNPIYWVIKPGPLQGQFPVFCGTLRGYPLGVVAANGQIHRLAEQPPTKHPFFGYTDIKVNVHKWVVVRFSVLGLNSGYYSVNDHLNSSPMDTPVPGAGIHRLTTSNPQKGVLTTCFSWFGVNRRGRPAPGTGVSVG